MQGAIPACTCGRQSISDLLPEVSQTENSEQCSVVGSIDYFGNSPPLPAVSRTTVHADAKVIPRAGEQPPPIPPKKTRNGPPIPPKNSPSMSTTKKPSTSVSQSTNTLWSPKIIERSLVSGISSVSQGHHSPDTAFVSKRSPSNTTFSPPTLTRSPKAFSYCPTVNESPVDPSKNVISGGSSTLLLNSLEPSRSMVSSFSRHQNRHWNSKAIPLSSPQTNSKRNRSSHITNSTRPDHLLCGHESEQWSNYVPTTQCLNQTSNGARSGCGVLHLISSTVNQLFRSRPETNTRKVIPVGGSEQAESSRGDVHCFLQEISTHSDVSTTHTSSRVKTSSASITCGGSLWQRSKSCLPTQNTYIPDTSVEMPTSLSCHSSPAPVMVSKCYRSQVLCPATPGSIECGLSSQPPGNGVCSCLNSTQCHIVDSHASQPISLSHSQRATASRHSVSLPTTNTLDATIRSEGRLRHPLRPFANRRRAWKSHRRSPPQSLLPGSDSQAITTDQEVSDVPGKSDVGDVNGPCQCSACNPHCTLSSSGGIGASSSLPRNLNSTATTNAMASSQSTVNGRNGSVHHVVHIHHVHHVHHHHHHHHHRDNEDERLGDLVGTGEVHQLTGSRLSCDCRTPICTTTRTGNGRNSTPPVLCCSSQALERPSSSVDIVLSAEETLNAHHICHLCCSPPPPRRRLRSPPSPEHPATSRLDSATRKRDERARDRTAGSLCNSTNNPGSPDINARGGSEAHNRVVTAAAPPTEGAVVSPTTAVVSHHRPRAPVVVVSNGTPARISPPQTMTREVLENGAFQRSMQELRKMGWYWGPLSFQEAQILLAKRPDGTFLVRDSGHDTYILSLSFRVRGETYHTRIEHSQGRFSFWSQPQSHSARTMVEFIEKAVIHSISGQYHYFLQSSAQDQPPVEVPLLYPLSRFQVVSSLRHLTRFAILSCTRRDHLEELPLPQCLIAYLLEKQCYVESLEAFEEAIRDRTPLEFVSPSQQPPPPVPETFPGHQAVITADSSVTRSGLVVVAAAATAAAAATTTTVAGVNGAGSLDPSAQTTITTPSPSN